MIAVKALIREVRERKEITQQAVADAARLSARTINRWENEEQRRINGDALLRIIDYLGIPWSYLSTVLNDDQAGVREGQVQALHWLDDINEQEAQALYEELGPTRVAEVLRQYRPGGSTRDPTP